MTLGNSEVLIAALTEASIAAPIVSNDQRSRRDGALDEPTERLGATVEHDGEPNASGIASVFPVVELGARLSMTHLDGTLTRSRLRFSSCQTTGGILLPKKRPGALLSMRRVAKTQPPRENAGRPQPAQGARFRPTGYLPTPYAPDGYQRPARHPCRGGTRPAAGPVPWPVS